MSSRIFYLICLPVLVLCGIGIGVWQNSGRVWQRDAEMMGGPVRSTELPNLVLDGGLSDQQSNRQAEASKFAFGPVPDSGVDFVYSNGPDDQFHLAETLGGGVAAIDYDLDGRDDLIFANGGNPVTWSQNAQLQVGVFRSGQDKFRDYTAVVGIDWTGYGHGVAAADINNDGFDDLLITGYQASSLYINNGDGTYGRSDALQQSTTGRWCATAAFSDLDKDGDTDLYITCYADTPRTLPTPVCLSGEQRIHCHPHFYNAQADLLLENMGDGVFLDRSESSGIGNYTEFGLGIKIADFDRDGQMEIFVANDGDRNLLFNAVSPWVFTELAITSGLAFNGVGETMGSMGVACADFDHNGSFDLLTTNFALERNVLFSNLGGLTFVDDSQSSPIDIASRAKVGWSAVTLDADQDGWSDLFVANGHVTQMPQESYAQLPDFFAGNSDGLQSVTPKTGGDASDYFQQTWHGRGAARTDLNGDHKDDLVVSHIDEAASLLENQTPSKSEVLAIRLIGTESANSANGAVVEVVLQDQTRVMHHDRNAGYLSSNTSVIRIAVGAATQVKFITITWPSGRSQTLSNLETNILSTVVEGRPVIH